MTGGGGNTEAGGNASVAIGGDASGAQVTTTNAEAHSGGKVEINNYYDTPNEPRTSLVSPPINNLPPIAAAFTGRGREEEEIVAALAGKGGSATISALKGIGGVGKTALAVKIGHRLTVQFPDAQLLIDLRGTSDAPMRPRVAMESVIRRFHPEGQLPDDDAAVLEIYRDLLHRKKVFLILDNARDTAQVERLLPPPPSAAIVTSRQVLHLADARSIRLDDLPLPDAATLVLKLLDGERLLSEVEVRRLAHDCCLCHPLSLRVAALFLRGHKGRSVSDYIASVEKDRARLKLQGMPDHDVLAVIGQSVAQLQAEDEVLCANWRDLSVFPSRFDADAAATIWSIDDLDAVSDRLCALEGRGLIEPVTEDRYRLHDLLRDVARRDWSAERAEAATRRRAEYFKVVLEIADALYHHGGDATAMGLALFDQERTNIEAGQRWAASETGKSDEAARLAAAYANAGASVLSLRLHPREWIRWSEAALEGCRRIGDRRGEGNVLGHLGIAYAALGETREAIERHEESLTIVHEIGDRQGEGAALGNLGFAYSLLGETHKAIEYYEQQLTIAREILDRGGEGHALGHLGIAYALLGETRKAIEHYEQALTIFCEIWDHRGEGSVHANLGQALKESDPDAARAHWQGALAIFAAIEDPNAARVAEWLSELEGKLGHKVDSIEGIAMSGKDTRAIGAGSIAIGGSVRGVKISTHVSTSANSEAADLPPSGSKAGGVIAEGPAAVAVGGNVEHSEIRTNFEDRSVGTKAAVGDRLARTAKNGLVDILIITALPIEYEAARDVATRLPERVVWEERDKDTPTPYLHGELRLADGRALSLALARPTRMGGPATLPVMAGLVARLEPRCLAMCGVCAGNPSDVALGDVIISEMVYYYDEGKRTTEGLEGDHRQVPMLDRLVRAAQELRPDDLPSFGDPSEKEARTWLLERLYAGDQPREHPARSRYFRGNEWQDRVRAMESEGLIRRNGLKLELTDQGRSRIEKAMFYDVESPAKLPFAIKVGPIASGQVVVKDGLTWGQLKKWGVRSVLGLEMEAAALGATAARLQVPVWFVAKGVMDHADPRKDDRYKPFAARASAEVLFKFLSQIFEPLPG